MVKTILYCEGNTDRTIGGSYYCLYDLVRDIDKNKYKPIVVFRTDNKLIPDFKKNGIETHIIKKNRALSLRELADRYSLKLERTIRLLLPLQKAYNFLFRFLIPAFKVFIYIKKWDVDLVHLNNAIVRNFDFMLAARLAGVRCITHERGINDFYPKTSRIFAKRLDAIISISKAVKNNLIKHKIDNANILIIRDCIDQTRIKISKTDEEVRQHLKIEPTSPVIGVVGNIKRWKGQETVIRATYLIKKRYPDIKCLVVGAVSHINYGNKLQKICDEKDLNENIIFTGYQKNVPNFMNAMSIVIHSSILPEPFGIVNLEAMALKKPVVSTNIGAPLEVVVDGKTGILVTPGEPDALAAAVLGLLAEPKTMKKMGEAGYERLCNEFTLSQNTGKTQELYQRLLA